MLVGSRVLLEEGCEDEGSGGSGGKEWHGIEKPFTVAKRDHGIAP